jgi:beta-lactamase superfamily II metal-dependent hydrolase
MGSLVCQQTARTTDKPLRAYFIDVEGGQATLFVLPTGQSLLIDTGSPGFAGRDADRIVAAAKIADLSRIDFVLLTHFHGDHTGGVPQLVERIPVGTFIDHGPNRERTGTTEEAWQAYQKVLTTGQYRHIVAHPGDVLPIPGIKVEVITSDGELIAHPLPGGGENPYCTASESTTSDLTENGRSLGVLITFGKIKILDLGDLTRDKEMQLMCPLNRIGQVDILVVSHHGLNLSSSNALVDAIHTRVAIMDNGPVKGGDPEVLDTIRQAPGMETLWQLHFSKNGLTHNTALQYIANTDKGPDEGNYLELLASPNGQFSVFNSRTRASKNYVPK